VPIKQQSYLDDLKIKKQDPPEPKPPAKPLTKTQVKRQQQQNVAGGVWTNDHANDYTNYYNQKYGPNLVVNRKAGDENGSTKTTTPNSMHMKEEPGSSQPRRSPKKSVKKASTYEPMFEQPQAGAELSKKYPNISKATKKEDDIFNGGNNYGMGDY